MAIEIVDLPINSMVIFHSYVSFPFCLFFGFFTACFSSSPSSRTWMEGPFWKTQHQTLKRCKTHGFRLNISKKTIQWLLDPHGWDSIDISPFSMDFPIDFPMSHGFSRRFVAPAPRTSGPQLRHVLLPLPDTASAAVPQLPQAVREIYEEVLTEAKLEPWRCRGGCGKSWWMMHIYIHIIIYIYMIYLHIYILYIYKYDYRWIYAYMHICIHLIGYDHNWSLGV